MDSQPVNIISAQSSGISHYLNQTYKYRYLIWTLAHRNISIKYAQTLLGVGWVALQPLTNLIVYTFFFGFLVKIDTGNTPFVLFVFCGISAWSFFSNLVSETGTSLMQAQDLIKKIYFPKIVLPLSKVLTCLVDFTVAMLLLLIAMLLKGTDITFAIVLFPLFVLLTILCGFTIGLWLCALTVRNRDFYHLIPYLVGFGIWFTPVFYPGTLLPNSIAWMLYFNPMAGVLAGFRWTLLNDNPPSVYFAFTFLAVFVFLLLGLQYFYKTEQKIADYV